MKALAFGEILWDIIDGDPHLGGAPLNFAAHLAQCGAKSFIISRVGTDNLGRSSLARIEELGVTTKYVQSDPSHETGTVKITLTNGQPDYLIQKEVAYDFIEYTHALERLKKSEFDLFYFGSLAQRHEKSLETLRSILQDHHFKNVLYDVNLRKESFTADILFRSLRWATILKLNTEEVPILSSILFNEETSLEEFSKRITDQYPVRIVIITASADGCYIYTNQHLSHISGIKIKVADAIGAGDAFSAAFMYYYNKTKNPIEAATIANKVGAFVASQTGAIPRFTPEIKKMLKQRRKTAI